MKAATAQIYVDGVLILNATDLQYDGKKLKFTGLVLEGMVGKVKLLPENLAEYSPEKKTSKLEIRLSLF